MENFRILMRRWTLTKKAQVVCAAFVFLLTSALAVFQAMQISIANNGLGQEVFELGSLAMAPADVLVHAVGISQTIGYWTFQIIAVILDTILVFFFVGLLGRLIAMVKRKLQRPKL